MNRNKGHIHQSKQHPVGTKTSEYVGSKTAFGKNRKAYHKAAKGEFELKTASREQIIALRKKIIAIRMRNLAIAISIILIFLFLAVLGVRYIIKRAAEAKRLQNMETFQSPPTPGQPDGKLADLLQHCPMLKVGKI
jgi:hypothetical protein